MTLGKCFLVTTFHHLGLHRAKSDVYIDVRKNEHKNLQIKAHSIHFPLSELLSILIVPFFYQNDGYTFFYIS